MNLSNRLVNTYIFIENFNSSIEEKIKKFKQFSIIYENKTIPSENFFKILKFCKKNKAKLYILDNFKMVIKYRLDGLVISSKNKIVSKILFSQIKKKIEILGKVHNQLEFYQKKNQNCDFVFLSPLFFTKKYSENKILKISKFNLISLHWKLKLIALGGIKDSNYKKLKMTKSVGIGFKSLLNDKKKPAYT
jgi:thiamine-phosphate pyrophosphorylase